MLSFYLVGDSLRIVIKSFPYRPLEHVDPYFLDCLHSYSLLINILTGIRCGSSVPPPHSFFCLFQRPKNDAQKSILGVSNNKVASRALLPGVSGPSLGGVGAQRSQLLIWGAD
jgi:hypothetical protein